MKTKIIASALLVLAITGIVTVTERQSATTKNVILDRATNENLLLATAIAKHGDAIFTSLTRPSVVIANAFANNDDKSTRAFIQHRVLLPASVLDITQYDANGRCVWSFNDRCANIGAHHPDHRADIDYFQSRPDATIYVSRTYASSSLKRLTFSLSKPLRSKTKGFGGVIRTYIDPSNLIQNYQSLLKNEIARIALVGKDGYIRTRIFGDDRVTHDDDVRDRPVNRAAQSSKDGTKIVKAPSDGKELIIAWKSLESFPLYIISSTSLELELSPYAESHRQSISSAFLMILAAIGIYFAFLYWRRVTDKELELSRQKLVDAEELNRIKTSIVSTVAHELRTPLSAIVGFTELIGMTTKEDATRDYANTASSGANKLSLIIDNMLDLSKIDAGRFDRKTESIALKPFLEKTAELYAQAAHNQGIELLSEVAAPIALQCNEAALSRILFNLLNNAIKFTPSGSVTLRAKQDDTTAVVIEVADTGIGIPKKDIPKLFERFSDIDRQRHPQGKGSGLGLSLVKELVTLMGGEINVSSELNQGTCFSIRLPVTPPPRWSPPTRRVMMGVLQSPKRQLS